MTNRESKEESLGQSMISTDSVRGALKERHLQGKMQNSP